VILEVFVKFTDSQLKVAQNSFDKDWEVVIVHQIRKTYESVLLIFAVVQQLAREKCHVFDVSQVRPIMHKSCQDALQLFSHAWHPLIKTVHI